MKKCVCVYVCTWTSVFGVHCLCVAGMVGGVHKVNKVIYWVSCSITVIPLRQNLTECGAGQQAAAVSTPP